MLSNGLKAPIVPSVVRPLAVIVRLSAMALAESTLLPAVTFAPVKVVFAPRSNLILEILIAGRGDRTAVERRRPTGIGRDRRECRTSLPTAPPNSVLPPVSTVRPKPPSTVLAKLMLPPPVEVRHGRGR